MGDAGGTPNRGRLPSILLARKPRFTDSRNDTTATAKSKDGYTMAVSFWLETPPDLSLFSIHCTKPPHDSSQDLNFSDKPHVVGADGPFVLLRAVFYAARGRDEYFVYKAGSPPSLERIPSPPDELYYLCGVREWGILAHGGDGHYLLVGLRDAPSSESGDGYQLRVYSSETQSWSTRTLQNPCPGVDRVIPDKVVTLGQEGLLAWVDLSLGLLVCDLRLLLQRNQGPPGPAGAPVISCCFIPLPEPLPANRYKLSYPFAPSEKKRKHPSWDSEFRSACWFRDLACVNGVLKFVELENYPDPHPQNKEDDIVYDADLIMSLKCKPDDRDICMQLSSFRDAWRAVTWTRKLVWPPPPSSSSNFWRQACNVHVADIKKGAPLLTFRELYSAFPVLSPEDGDDIIYLKSMVKASDADGWVASLDIGNKVLKAVGQYYLPDEFYYDREFDPEHPFCAFTLSRHLDITPGIEVSACRKIPEASSSENHPNNTPIRVGELSSRKSRSKIQRLSDFAGELKRIRDRRLSKHNHQISQVHPVENYLPQQLKWTAPPVYPLRLHENNQVCAAPVYPSMLHEYNQVCAPPVYPSRLHENNQGYAHPEYPLRLQESNQQPQQCFNKSNGPFGPGYASLTPLHNYQPLWPPSKYQLTSSCEFKPQEAPQTYFNNNHGYSQQLYAPNPFAYGAHTGYDNYQQQWPIGASWQQPPPVVQRQPTP